MKYLGLISKCLPVIKNDGDWIRNPKVETDNFIQDGEIVYGEYKVDTELKAANNYIKSASINFELLDKELNKILWTYTNLFPGCLIKSIEGIRTKKKFFWDQSKVINRHWLAANMNGEAFLGFTAFNTKKITGKDTIDFIKYRQLQSNGAPFDLEFMSSVLAKPKS